MATASVTASLLCRSTFVSVVIFLGCLGHVGCYAPSIEVTCKSTVDLGNNNFDAGLIVSMLPPRIPIYANEEERCDIYMSIPTGHEMMLYFDWLDLYSGELSKCDTTNIELFDGSANNYVKGLQRKICGREEQMPTNVYFVDNNFLVIRVNALGAIQGTGFRIHFTISRRAFPCSNDEFACETFGSRRCIAEHLVCDDWNDCGDWVDEEQNCNNITAGGIAAIVVASILLIALVIGLIIFCKIRRQREMMEMSEKEAAIMRDQSMASGGMVSPFSVSSETMEKDPYMPRYATGRNSGRRSQASARNNFDDRPPPYTEKPSYDDSRSEEGLYDDQGNPRTRRKSRNRESTPDEVFEGEEEVPRSRRGRSKSQDERTPSRVEEEPMREERYQAREGRYPSKREDRDSPSEDRRPPRDRDDRRRDDRDPRDRDDRYPPRRDDRDSDSKHSREDDLERERDRYPSRRQDRDRERDDDRYPSRRDDRDDDRHPSRRDDRYRDDDRYPSRRDDRDRERDDDRYPSRRDDRDDDRYPSRRDDRDRDRDRDPRRDRPRSRHDTHGDDHDDLPDQLHPMREQKRRSMHSDSDHDTSREDRRSREDVRHPPRDDHDDRNNRPRDRERERERDERPRDDRYPPRDRDRDDRYPPRERDDRPPATRDERSPSTRDDSSRAAPTSRSKDNTPDDSYESAQENAPASNRGRRARPESRDTPAAPPPVERNPDLEAEEPPARRRRRRSRSRDGQDRPRSSRYGEEPEEGGGRKNKAPMAQMEDEPRRPGGRQSVGGYREETV